MLTTITHQQETASNVIRPDIEAPYIMTYVPAPPELPDPKHLIAPVVPQTPARLSIGPCFPMTGNSMTNTQARIRSSPTHGLTNGIGNALQTIVVTDQIPILRNLHSYDLRQFIEIITSRAVDNNTAQLCIDRRNRNLITLKL